MVPQIEFINGNLHLPDLKLWLDPHEPQVEPVFVSHAHSDHIAEHQDIILSAPTARLMQTRMAGKWHQHVMNFGEPQHFQAGENAFELTLLPAGHIFGSAMALLNVPAVSILYTGDFKLRPGLSAEPCRPQAADILIMETTYGRPQYVFPPTADVLKGVVRFCREALDNGETPVLLGYSLGKSQELLCSLGDENLPLMLHGAVYKLTKIYEQFGQCFPKYERYEAGLAQGKVLLCPPNVVNSAMLRNLGRTRTAILTGWAVDSNCRFRYQCDAAFPLSDHADFTDLIEMVKLVQPKKIYTLHGFATDFAQTLRDLGYDAQALSEQEQFTLPLIIQSSKSKAPGAGVFSQNERGHGTNRQSEKLPADPATAPFVGFANACSRIAGTTSKLEKIQFVADYFRETQLARAVALTATWFSGYPFPPSQGKILQLGWAVLRNALSAISELDEAAVLQIYLKHSDLGETAFDLFQARTTVASLTIAEVDRTFHSLQAARGPLAKTPILQALLQRCTAMEAKYLVKIITGDLRIGLKEGLVEEAISSAFSKPAQRVRQANLLLGDIGETARLAAENKLEQARLIPFRPVKLMLASPEENAQTIWKRLTQDAGASAVWLEDKYDGIRCQLHKVGGRVELYSRDLKEITGTFLELADAARRLPADFIFDGEIVAMQDNEILPFAELQKRLGRREGDLFMHEEVPIRLVTFDLLWLTGESLLGRALRERRHALESLEPLPPLFRLARITQAKSVEEIEQAFSSARGRGNEGLMIKDPDSLYTPGRRGLAWLKLKKAFATLDCVVVGVEYGHGKRNKVLSDYTFAVRDEGTGELKTIGKAYTGLTDAEIAQLTIHFKQQAIRQHGRYFEVKPDTVLEIAFDRIQPSDRHNSGLALRFPRIARIRTDKTPEEIDTVASARKLLASKGPGKVK